MFANFWAALERFIHPLLRFSCKNQDMSGDEQPYPIHPDHEVEEAKFAFRAAIREARANRSDRRRSVAAEGLAIVVNTIPQVKAAHTVALYASRPTELQTQILMEKLAAAGKRILLPVLGAGLQRDWAWYSGTDDLMQRAPGRPPEPSGETLGSDALSRADVVLVPALAVDTAGHRLGQGGGWYDRALEHVRSDVDVIALVYPEEIYNATTHPLPIEPHDRPVDAVATPQHWGRIGELSEILA